MSLCKCDVYYITKWRLKKCQSSLYEELKILGMHVYHKYNKLKILKPSQRLFAVIT